MIIVARIWEGPRIPDRGATLDFCFQVRLRHIRTYRPTFDADPVSIALRIRNAAHLLGTPGTGEACLPPRILADAHARARYASVPVGR